jgi:hypothetical protein
LTNGINQLFQICRSILPIQTETVVKNLPHQEVEIVNMENGQTPALGEAGEICFRGYHITLPCRYRPIISA